MNLNALAAALITTVVMALGITPASAAPSLTSGSSTISSLLNFNAPAGTVVSQGDEIHTTRGIGVAGTCTLGYIDRHARTAYTAGHCAIPGEPVYNTNRKIIGFTEQSNFFTHYVGEPDVARIKLVNGVVPGENWLTGDAYVPVHTVSPGEEICVWGAATRQTFCGHVLHRRGADLLTNAHGTTRGDSGGPAWIPGRGFVAVNSAWEDSLTYGGNEVFVSPDGL